MFGVREKEWMNEVVRGGWLQGEEHEEERRRETVALYEDNVGGSMQDNIKFSEIISGDDTWRWPLC